MPVAKALMASSGAVGRSIIYTVEFVRGHVPLIISFLALASPFNPQL